MKAATFDPTKLNHVVEVLESLHRHRVAQPLDKSDELYYEILANYFRDVRDAKEQGKFLAYFAGPLPREVFCAFDMVGAAGPPVATTIVNLCNLWEDGLATAKAYGMAPEVCSLYRHNTSSVLNGWLPRPDAVVWSNLVCDNTAKGGDIAARLWECPGYCLDRGYDVTDRELEYFTRELEGLVAFLERVSGQKVDWDRLVQAADNTRQLMILQREVEELRKAVPTPIRARSGMYMHVISMYLAGTPEAVTFFRQMRDEAKARVESGGGFVREERYRLLMFYEPPVYGWKLLDWLERAHGATFVFEPAFGQWGPGDIDPANPLAALAYKTFIRPYNRQNHSRVELLVSDMVQAAKEYRADGMVSFCHVGCRQSASCNRLLKDKLMAEAGLPFFAVEHDIADPAFTSEEEMRDRIEGFLEMIDERRG